MWTIPHSPNTALHIHWLYNVWILLSLISRETEDHIQRACVICVVQCSMGLSVIIKICFREVMNKKTRPHFKMDDFLSRYEWRIIIAHEKHIIR